MQADEVARGRGGNPAASIVGLWKFTVSSKGNTSHNPPIPDGAVIDWGYSQWDSRRERILYFRAPLAGQRKYLHGHLGTGR